MYATKGGKRESRDGAESCPGLEQAPGTSSARAGMHVILVGTRAVSVIMTVLVHFHRHEIDLAMTDFAHRHQFVCEFAHFASCAAQDDGLQAVVVIEMDMH